MVSRAERRTEDAFVKSGRTPDGVGPGAYNLSGKWGAKPNFSGFGSSMVRHDKSVGASRNPGPGTYRPEGEGTLKVDGGKNRRGTNALVSTAPRTVDLARCRGDHRGVATH